jgi:hypothetical protein
MVTTPKPEVICNVMLTIKVTVKDDVWDDSWTLADLRKEAAKQAIGAVESVIAGGKGQYGKGMDLIVCKDIRVSSCIIPAVESTGE